jgi:glycosyltransferase involved in cell wall biosynthesis
MAALAHGLPIVSTTLSGIPTDAMKQFPMLEDGESALLVPPDQPVKTAEAVMRLMTGNALRSHLAAKAAVLSRQFEWETLAQGHLLAYRGLGKG